MTFWTDKQGNKLTFKQFMSRWKEGINKVSPLEQTRAQLVFSYITLVGIVCGIIATLFAYKTLWWLLIILIAALGNTWVSTIGIYQKYSHLKKIDLLIKQQQEVKNEQESTIGI